MEKVVVARNCVGAAAARLAPLEGGPLPSRPLLLLLVGVCARQARRRDRLPCLPQLADSRAPGRGAPACREVSCRASTDQGDTSPQVEACMRLAEGAGVQWPETVVAVHATRTSRPAGPCGGKPSATSGASKARVKGGQPATLRTGQWHYRTLVCDTHSNTAACAATPALTHAAAALRPPFLGAVCVWGGGRGLPCSLLAASASTGSQRAACRY